MHTQKELEAMCDDEIMTIIASYTPLGILPIAIESQIWLSYSANKAVASKWHNGKMIRASHENPLRAFAIVYILITQE